MGTPDISKPHNNVVIASFFHAYIPYVAATPPQILQLIT
jgi:hypothetical protein